MKFCVILLTEIYLCLQYSQPKTFTYKRERSEIVIHNMFGLLKLHKMGKVLLWIKKKKKSTDVGG